MISSFHSFRRGVGRTTLIGSLAMIMASQGKRIGVLDLALESPGMQVLFGLKDYGITHYVNDAVKGRCGIADTVINLSKHLDPAPKGALYVAPANPMHSAIAESTSQEAPEADDIRNAILGFHDAYQLDMLLVDNHAGMNQTSLTAMSMAERMVIMFRLDQQEHQGTAVVVDLARTFAANDDSAIKLIVNDIPDAVSTDSVRADAFRIYNAPVIGVLPHTEEIQVLGSQDVFTLVHPDHRLTTQIKQIAMQLW